MNTRTVLLWHNNGEERIYFTVNPARLTVTRPNENRVRSLAMGGAVNIWGGRGLREVRLTTFLPDASSPFYTGQEPETVLAMLKSWQDSGDPVRLIISGSDINDAFLIEDVSETLAEGDRGEVEEDFPNWHVTTVAVGRGRFPEDTAPLERAAEKLKPAHLEVEVLPGAALEAPHRAALTGGVMMEIWG